MRHLFPILIISILITFKDGTTTECKEKAGILPGTYFLRCVNNSLFGLTDDYKDYSIFDIEKITENK